MKKNLIVFRVIFNRNTGSGHLYQNLALIEAINREVYDISVIINEFDHSTNLDFPSDILVCEEKDDLEYILNSFPKNYKNKFFINDVLDTSVGDMEIIKSKNFRIINIEDKGKGASLANLLVNSLYENTGLNKNELNGPKYNIFRDEFYAEVESINKPNIKYPILISFGGTDPQKLTESTIQLLLNMKEEFKVINPPHRSIEKSLYEKYLIKGKVNVAKEINTSRFVISSGGRTVYEANYLKRMSLVICQNNRELTHYCLKLPSVTNLGLSSSFNPTLFSESIKHLNEKIQENTTKLFHDSWLSKKDLVKLLLEKV